MSSDPIRAALERLVEALNDYDPKWDAFPEDALTAALAALAAAQEGEGPSAEQVEDLCEEHCFNVEGYESIECLQGLINDALARWNRPAAPPAPLEGEVGELVAKLCRLAPQNPLGSADPTILRAATLLSQLSAATSAVVPIPVSERLPGEDDCDAEGTCWVWNRTASTWGLFRFDLTAHSHWLPAHALPFPAPQGGEVEA